MPLIRKSTKIASNEGSSPKNTGGKVSSGASDKSSVAGTDSEGKKSDGKIDSKDSQRNKMHKENDPRNDSCGRNGIIRFPLIPGVTLQRRKTGKQLKASKHGQGPNAEKKTASVPVSAAEESPPPPPPRERRVKFAETPAKKPQEPSKNVKTDQKTFYPRFKTNMGLLPELVVPQVPEIAALAELVPEDPISACLPCLEANGTYICTPCNPRCFIIQKVTTSPTGVVPPAGQPPLNPDAMVFEAAGQADGSTTIAALGSVVDTPVSDNSDQLDFDTDDGYAYMNGDVGKLPSGAVYSTPDTMLPPPAPDYSSVNGVSEAAEHYEGGGGTAEGSGSAPPDDANVPANPPPDAATYPIEDLKQQLSSQLEYYFSRENLANDAYLLSQMDNDQYVPIWTVANFNQVKKLTTDIKLITQVLRDSPNVQVDEEGQKVRPNHKRCIVILREIPDSTPLEQVRDLFSGEGCPKVISCEFAHNNSWYVTFESDEDAQRAYRFLREEVKEFQGKPIMARIKAKPMNRMAMSAVGGGPMKNGYRSPPVFDPASGPFQPAGPVPGPQQRFLYANGSSIPTPVPYNNQPLHVYTFPQTNQPFYPPPMLQPWGAANTFFDIGSVFSVNGLAPQQSFTKPATSRYVPRSRSSTKRPSSDRGSASESPTPRSQQHTGPTAPPNVAAATTVATVASPIPVAGKVPGPQARLKPAPGTEASHSKDTADSAAVRLSEPIDSNFRQSKDKSDSSSIGDRHRRRRKDEEGGLGSPSGSQFDLEAAAFPPLPAGAVLKTVAVETETVPQSHWGENRLADVVKGTAKHKGTATTNTTNSSTITTTQQEGGSRNPSPPVSSAPPVPPVPPAPAVSPKPAPPPSAEQCQQSVEKPCKNGDGSSPGTPAPAPAVPTAPAVATFAVATTPTTTNSSCDANTTILTPPPSPIKCVVPVPKCATADKATKTDDILLNGDAEKVEKGEKPATTNAATMTSSEPPPQSPVPSDVPPRLSYAQVAQHPKEKPGEKPAPEPERERKKEGSCSREVRTVEKDKREEGFREVTSRAASRANSRQAAAGTSRRRDVTSRPPRDAK